MSDRRTDARRNLHCGVQLQTFVYDSVQCAKTPVMSYPTPSRECATRRPKSPAHSKAQPGASTHYVYAKREVLLEIGGLAHPLNVTTFRCGTAVCLRHTYTHTLSHQAAEIYVCVFVWAHITMYNCPFQQSWRESRATDYALPVHIHLRLMCVCVCALHGHHFTPLPTSVCKTTQLRI